MAYPKRHVEIGRRYGALTVRAEHPERLYRERAWICDCACGGSAVRHTSAILNIKNIGCKSCEPVRRALNRVTHGELVGIRGRQPRLYSIWNNRHARCGNSLSPDWRRYGGRGITVCAEWGDFAAFRAWAQAHGYAANLTIDRVNNDGNYEPGNCEWVTRGENTRRQKALRSPEERSADGRRNLATARKNARDKILAEFGIADWSQHLPLEALMGCV